MKTILLFTVLCFFGLNSIGQQASSGAKNKTVKHKTKSKQPYQYCAKMKDGILVMMHEEKEMITDVTLANGTKIRTDASVTRPDGVVIHLEDGQCVDEAGNVFPDEPKIKYRNKEEEKGKIPPQQ
jgi:ribosomal protein L14